LIPCSLHISTKLAFSERKPYPGCNIVHPRLIAADKTFGITKYLYTVNGDVNAVILGDENYETKIR